MATYKSGNAELRMDSGNKNEWVTVYIKDEQRLWLKQGKKEVLNTVKLDIGMRFTRKMAYALIKELEARLFGGTHEDIRIGTVIEEKDSDMCFID